MLFTEDPAIIQVYVDHIVRVRHSVVFPDADLGSQLPLIILAVVFNDVTSPCYGILRASGKAVCLAIAEY